MCWIASRSAPVSAQRTVDVESTIPGRPRQGRSSTAPVPAVRLAELLEERRKLLRLYYADQIADDLYAEEEARTQIGALRAAEDDETAEKRRFADVGRRFDQIAAYLAQVDIDALWQAATQVERRILIDELIEAVDVHDDHLEVTVRGAPKLNVTLAEVGLGRQGEFQSCRRGDFNP